VKSNVLLVDLGIAIVAAIIVLAITPGLAVASIIAIAVLIACTVSLRRESQRHRRARPRRHITRRDGRAGSQTTSRNDRP
jgi:hypothetical protein